MTRRSNLLLAEIRESFAMAMNALTAHKLRSALTLLGVLIGVFSIIVVMTAMRVLKRTAENGLSQLGSQTFAVQRWPEAQFGDNSDWQKYWRRKYVTLDQGRKVEEKATLAAIVGIEGNFWRGQISTRFARTAPTSMLYGETPGSFPARNWDIEEGRALSEDDVVHGRNGLPGPRPDKQIGVHSLRGGDVIGDHTVIFAGDGERLELTHRASQRAIFATGALRAAQWLVREKKPPGLYGMDDVLGLKV